MSYEQKKARAYLRAKPEFPDLSGGEFGPPAQGIHVNAKSSLCIGKGSEGVVYFGGVVKNLESTIVAVKRILSDDDEEKKGMSTQIRTLIKLQHKNVTKYLDSDYNDDFQLIAFELCLGSLVNLLENGNTVFDEKFPIIDIDANWGLKKQMVREIAEGIVYLYEESIIHRDLKPSNILIKYNQRTKSIIPVISDFGLSREVPLERIKVTVSQQRLGTSGWMAPEIINGSKKPGFAADMFSFGCIVQFIMSHQRGSLTSPVKAEHPFGVNLHRNGNIQKNKRISYVTTDTHINADTIFADMLIDICVIAAAGKRLCAPELLRHPFFWTESEKMQYFNTCHTWIKEEDLKHPKYPKYRETVDSFWAKFTETATSKQKGESKNKLSKKNENSVESPAEIPVETLPGFDCKISDSLFEIVRRIRNKMQHPCPHKASLNSPEELGPGSDEDLYRYCFQGQFAAVLPMTYICAQPILMKIHKDRVPVLSPYDAVMQCCNRTFPSLFKFKGLRLTRDALESAFEIDRANLILRDTVVPSTLR